MKVNFDHKVSKQSRCVCVRGVCVGVCVCVCVCVYFVFRHLLSLFCRCLKSRALCARVHLCSRCFQVFKSQGLLERHWQQVHTGKLCLLDESFYISQWPVGMGR